VILIRTMTQASRISSVNTARESDEATCRPPQADAADIFSYTL
jgi:hypothetical protein